MLAWENTSFGLDGQKFIYYYIDMVLEVLHILMDNFLDSRKKNDANNLHGIT